MTHLKILKSKFFNLGHGQRATMPKQCLPHEQYCLTASSQQQRHDVYLGKTHCSAETPKLALAELIQRVETQRNHVISSSQNWLRSKAILLKMSITVLHLAGTKGISGTIPCQANLHIGFVWAFLLILISVLMLQHQLFSLLYIFANTSSHRR